MKIWHKDIDDWVLDNENRLRCSPVLTSTSKNRHELGLEIISLGPFSQPILCCEQKNTYFLPGQLIISSGPTSFSPRFISTTSPEQTSNCSNQLNGCKRHKCTGMMQCGLFLLCSFFFFTKSRTIIIEADHRLVNRSWMDVAMDAFIAIPVTHTHAHTRHNT